MPTFPRARLANVTAIALLAEALLLAVSGWAFLRLLAAMDPDFSGIPFRATLLNGIVYGFPAVLVVGAIGLATGWKPGWWVALAAEMTMLLAAPAGAYAGLRMLATAPGEGAVEDPGAMTHFAGLILLAISRLGWHLLLSLGLLRADVRERMGVAELAPWPAAARGALLGSLTMLMVVGLRLAAGF